MKIKFDVTYDGVREIRFCAHKTDNPCPEKPLRRTLFLSGVPPWANESGLERIFSQNGKISKVYLNRKASSNVTEEDKRDYSSIEKHLWPIKDTSGFKFGYIVYEKEASLKKALKMDLNHLNMCVYDACKVFLKKNYLEAPGLTMHDLLLYNVHNQSSIL